MSIRCQKWKIKVSVHFGRRFLILGKKTEDRRPKEEEVLAVPKAFGIRRWKTADLRRGS
jgi:hypothetical protein